MNKKNTDQNYQIMLNVIPVNCLLIISVWQKRISEHHEIDSMKSEDADEIIMSVDLQKVLMF